VQYVFTERFCQDPLENYFVGYWAAEVIIPVLVSLVTMITQFVEQKYLNQLKMAIHKTIQRQFK